MTAFSWKALQAELSASPYLSPEDDILSQRGIIATAMAIMDKMTNSEVLREVTWKPVVPIAYIVYCLPWKTRQLGKLIETNSLVEISA